MEYDPFLNLKVKKIKIVKCPECQGQLHVASEEYGVCATCGRTIKFDPKPTPEKQPEQGKEE